MATAQKAPSRRTSKRAAGVPVDALAAHGSAGHTAEARTAFSYLRVSSGKQAAEARSGLDRQADQFLPFCQRHGLLASVDPLVDAGISAYRGRNRRQGALGQFLDAARDGLIPAGSVLVVEDLDRFSREAPSYAEAQLGELFLLGLALGIVRDDQVIDRSTYDADIGVRLQLLVRRDAAHDYSRKLSERVSAAHEGIRARERQGEIVNAHWKPQWLDYDAAAGAFTPNDRWPIYRRILDLCLDGFGQTRVAAMVNGEGHRNAHGNLWSGASVAQVWRDRRLIGERAYGRGRVSEVEILPGYFPAMITTAEWQRLQECVAQRRNNTGQVGRGEQRHNILQGLCFCVCGMRQELHTATKPSGRKHAYLVCKSKIRGRRVGDGVCMARNVPYVERDLLQAFMANKWARFFDRPADNKRRRELDRQVREAEALLAKQRQQQEQAQANIAELLLAGSLEPDTAALLGRVAKDAKSHADATEVTLGALRDQLRQASIRPDGAAMQKAIMERVEAFMATGLSDPAERVKFNAWLTTLGLTVSLYRDSRGRVEMDFSLADAAAWGMDEASIAALRADLVARAMR